VTVQGVTGNILPGTNFTRGQAVTVVATPDDDALSGAAVTGNSVTIQNAPPAAPTVRTLPAAAGDADDLVCSVTGQSGDADGDNLFFDFVWTRNGLPFSGAKQGSPTSSTVPAGSPLPSDTYACVVSAYDGSCSSPTASTSVTIGSAQLQGIAGKRSRQPQRRLHH